MSQNLEVGSTINPLSVDASSQSAAVTTSSEKSTASIGTEEGPIICGGVLLPDFISQWRLVKKIRVEAKPPTDFTRFVLIVRYAAMAYGRASAIYAFTQIQSNSANCKDLNGNGDDATSPSECQGVIITLVVLGVFIASINDAVWVTSFVGVKSDDFRFGPLIELWLQIEIIVGLASLHLWYTLFFPFVLLLKGLLCLLCIGKLGKVWVALTVMSLAAAVMALVCLLMYVISGIAGMKTILIRVFLFLVSGLSFAFSLGQLVCFRSKYVCWIFKSNPPVADIV